MGGGGGDRAKKIIPRKKLGKNLPMHSANKNPSLEDKPINFT
jgi:hypothetical protein